MIGSFRGVHAAELPVRDTILAETLVRDMRLRELTGLSVVGLRERGRLQPAFPHTSIRADAVGQAICFNRSVGSFTSIQWATH